MARDKANTVEPRIPNSSAPLRMTSRQRLLAAYRGQEVDRLPYWAKVCNPTWRTSQPENIRKRTNLDLLDFIGADGLFHCASGMKAARPHVNHETKINGLVRTVVTKTPDGDLVERWQKDEATQSWHPIEFPVKTVEDLNRIRWYYQDLRLEVDERAVDNAKAEYRKIGQRGVFASGWGTSPLMHLVEHVIGPVNTHLMLADYRSEMDDLIELMHQDCLTRVTFVAQHTPADVVISTENTSTTLISPHQFNKYCYKHLCEYGQAIEGAGKMHELHMCGHTKALLPKIDSIPASSIEAYTSPTLGNTRLVDGRTLAPSKTLIGGTNVNVWLMPVSRIQEYIAGELAVCKDHRRIVLTTAGVAPPACPAEKFRAIGQWIATLPVRM